ncbi:MAG: hypothetical protein AAFX54_10200 [Pseudomonadota bacterium]
MLKKILFFASSIFAATLFAIVGYVVAYDNGLFCKPVDVLYSDTIVVLDFENKNQDGYPQRTVVSDNKYISSISDFMKSRRRHWRGNGAFVAHSTDYRIEFADRPDYIGFSLIEDSESQLFLSIGDCIQNVSNTDGEPFIKLLKKSGVLES